MKLVKVRGLEFTPLRKAMLIGKRLNKRTFLRRFHASMGLNRRLP